MQTASVFVSPSTASTLTCHIRLHANVPALLLLTVPIVNRHHTSFRHWWICFTRKFISLFLPVLLCVCKEMVSAITLYAWGCLPYRCWYENFIWNCIICILECDKFCCIWVLCDRLQYKHLHVHENTLRMHFLNICHVMQHIV